MRSMTLRRCISPWPASTVSPVSASCRTVSVGSSSASFCSAPDSRTSSLRSVVVIAASNTGAGAVGNDSIASPASPSTVPVAMPSRRPSDTTSPAPASAILAGSPPGRRQMPPSRTPLSVAPSLSGPRQTRPHETLPPAPPLIVRNTCTRGPPAGSTPRRSAVATAEGASCRSDFHSRKTPQARSAAPSSTPPTVPAASSWRSRS